MIDLCGIDYLTYGESDWNGNASSSGFSRARQAQQSSVHKEQRFGVIYHLLSVEDNQRLRVKALLSLDNLMIQSVTNIWNSADWFEREAFDKDKGFVYANSQIVKGLQNRRQKELELFKQQQKQQELATPEPKLDVPKHNPDAPEQPIAQVPKYGTVEWYKKYGTDPNQAVDA